MRRKQDLVSCDPGNKDVVTYDQYDLFYPNDLGDPTNSPSPDREKASYIPGF